MRDVILEWLKEWQFWLALMTIGGGMFSAYKYFDGKKTKQLQQDFDNYHKLIIWINRSSDNQPISLQVQQAAIFELRNYKRYKELTIKLLEHWSNDERYKELSDVASDTLNFLRKSN